MISKKTGFKLVVRKVFSFIRTLYLIFALLFSPFAIFGEIFGWGKVEKFLKSKSISINLDNFFAFLSIFTALFLISFLLEKRPKANTMKKYLGGYMLGFWACVLPVLILLELAVAVVPICSKISFPTIVLSLFGVLGTIVTVIWLKQTALDLYSWGTFSKKGVVVKSLFTTHEIEYKKCQSCGIGYYHHSFLNSKIGSKVKFIYLSYDGFEEKYRTKMNSFKNSKRQIKISYNKKVFNYLVKHLPKDLSKALVESQNNFK